ncbi:hypothetical protein CEXT_144531 [Caerostris extrusa]|uniref:Uncharacterized protein n=1 Tax=Caerostris extrusa TaxID=172846 RepID=A0AAV4Y6W8_CAEEX|nr:hypothetical protein CEXT_144531 [Caerostris extrusa]
MYNSTTMKQISVSEVICERIPCGLVYPSRWPLLTVKLMSHEYFASTSSELPSMLEGQDLPCQIRRES